MGNISINHRDRKELVLAKKYLKAKEFVIDKGFSNEIDWQDERQLSLLSEKEFIQEAAWVILSAGMRETVIRKLFPSLSSAFLFWESAACIIADATSCKRRALAIFNHHGKIQAILSLCYKVHRYGFEAVKSKIVQQGVSYLKSFEFIGPVTCFHLAKNIGLDVVKHDRHLLRIAKAARISNPTDMCRIIMELTGDRIGVVDLVLWRFATLDKKYIKYFCDD